MQTKSFQKNWFLSVDFEKCTCINQKSNKSQSGVSKAVIGGSSDLMMKTS